MSIKPVYLVFAVAIYFPVVHAQDVEFNTHILNTDDRQNVDLSAFGQEGYVAPGEYLLDIYLNDQLMSEQRIVQFFKPDGEENTVACLDDSLVGLAGLKADVREQWRHYPGTDCNNLKDTGSHIKYSPEEQRLSLSVPQAWLEYQDERWIPPSRWENGIDGFIFDYNMLAGWLMPHQGNTSSNYSLYGTAGLNSGAWRLRSDYQYSLYKSGNSQQTSLTFPRTYLFRPVPGLRSRLVAGQTYLNSDLFDSLSFTGVSLTSDNRMLPPSLRGYAPQISGIARSHAQVTVSRDGRIIWQSQVPAGPFVIPDLSETVRGNLDVTVREDNGEVHSWQVNTASVPFLARRGNIFYKAAVGKPLYNGGRHTTEPLFSVGEMTWGAFSNTSLYGGFILSDSRYRALAMGVGENMGIPGAVSFDVTQSTAQIRNQSRKTGYSYRVNYAKTFDKTGSSVTFAGYRFSDKNFISMNQYLDLRNGYAGTPAEKQRYVLTFNQAFGASGLNLMLSASHRNYWDRPATENYTMSLNKSFSTGLFSGATASLSLGRNNMPGGEKDNQLYFSLTLPSGSGRQVNYAIQHDSSGRMNQTATLYNRPSDKSSWALGVGQQREQGGKNRVLINGDYQQNTAYGQGDASFSMLDQQYTNLGLSWYGAFTATRHGAAFHQSIAGNGPRLMVDTSDIADVPVDHGRGVTNRFGVTVVPAGSSYERSDTAVDITQLPADISVQDGIISKVLTEGAIGYKKIAVTKGSQLVGTVRTAEGRSPPFGTLVKNHNGKTLGMIGDNGFTYLSGLSDADRNGLEITWSGGRCSLEIPQNTDLHSGVLLLPCH